MLLYFFLIFLASFGILYKYVLHFELFALVLGAFGAITIFSTKKMEKKQKWLFALVFLSIALIFVFRAIPFANNSVPLGYDPGMYKYGFEVYRDFLPNIPLEQLPVWLKNWAPPGFFTFTNLFYVSGLTTNQIMVPLFVLFAIALGLMVYSVTKAFFGRKAAVFSLFLYAVSVIEFKVFSMFYFKNTVGLILLLGSIYFLKKKKLVATAVTASMLAGVHRPTFLLFALSFVVYYFVNLKHWKQNTLTGIAIALLAVGFYLGRFNELVVSSLIPSVADPSAGTFINFFSYQFLILLYLPFALIAFFFLLKKRRFNFVFIAALVSFLIVFFRLVFFNRFIIFLELFVLILAGFGLKKFVESDYSKLAKSAVIALLIVSSVWLIANEAVNARPLVSEMELDSIIRIEKITELEALILCTSSFYSPWLQGYSGRAVIAPGLFDLDKWNRKQWEEFWETGDLDTVKGMLSVYGKPLYIFAGKKSVGNNNKFKNSCFEKIELDEEGTILYNYLCD